ncbi:MAG TPA: cytochrome b/b6 domain-containing protein [Nocardioides sp.]|nr:cytochrome b/b6 domain-containing protein [Nocardioides sp.]
MRLRNDEHGYGAVTKTLHWVTVGLLAAQLWIGYTMDAEADARGAECEPAGEDRSGGDTSVAEDERLDRVEEQCEAQQERVEDAADGEYDVAADGFDLPELHLVVGLALMGLALARVVWRRTTPLPPWDPRLTPVDRTLLKWVERALLALLFVVPLTGIALLRGGEELLWFHVVGHVALYTAIAVHVFVVVRRRVVGRMLPGAG